jgi:hypothetical protein
MIVLDLSQLFVTTAKLDALGDYQVRAQELAGEGNDIILTGAAPVWLYLAIAHALHGKARKLYYRAPALEEDLLIFDHDPY